VAVDPNWKGVDEELAALLFPALKLDPKENVVFCCPSFWLFPKTNILFVLLLVLLLALLVPKIAIDELGVPKPAVVVGVAPNRDLLSLNVVLLFVDPKARLVEFCVPKTFAPDDAPKVPAAEDVAFVPNMGTDDVLSVELNILVVLPKVGAVCTFVAVPIFVPNAGAALFVTSKLEGLIVLVEMLPNVVELVVCVVELNNDGVLVPNIAPVFVPKDVEGFVCPKINVPVLNTEDVGVVELVLALENKLEPAVLLREADVIVEAKIGDSVVFEVLNIFADLDTAPKTG